MITRIAPTPSGFLHVGNAVNFLLIQRIAKLRGCKILLRIDDLDRERVRAEYLQDVFDSLAWLKIDPDLGPKDPMDHQLNWSQRSRHQRYIDLLDRLRGLGSLYACTCSRSMLYAMDPEDHVCRNGIHDLDANDVSWRIRINKGVTVIMNGLQGEAMTIDVSDVIGDTTLRQRPINGVAMPTYQIASLADDVDRDVSAIVRGMDLLPSTALQLHLAELLQLDEFLKTRFWHHSLITDLDGKKLSKSAGASSLKAMGELGIKPDRIRSMADEVFQEQWDHTKPIA